MLIRSTTRGQVIQHVAPENGFLGVCWKHSEYPGRYARNRKSDGEDGFDLRGPFIGCDLDLAHMSQCQLRHNTKGNTRDVGSSVA